MCPTAAYRALPVFFFHLFVFLRMWRSSNDWRPFRIVHRAQRIRTTTHNKQAQRDLAVIRLTGIQSTELYLFYRCVLCCVHARCSCICIYAAAAYALHGTMTHPQFTSKQWFHYIYLYNFEINQQWNSFLPISASCDIGKRHVITMNCARCQFCNGRLGWVPLLIYAQFHCG